MAKDIGRLLVAIVFVIFLIPAGVVGFVLWCTRFGYQSGTETAEQLRGWIAGE